MVQDVENPQPIIIVRVRTADPHGIDAYAEVPGMIHVHFLEHLITRPRPNLQKQDKNGAKAKRLRFL